MAEGPDITSHGIQIKPACSSKIYLPACFGFAAQMSSFVANDALSLLGEERFTNSEIMFILQRNNIPKNKAHRPDFSGWHDHMKEPGKIDLIYSFSDTLPTEFQSEGESLFSHENSLVRFGAEIIHRSRENVAVDDLRRTWGAYVLRLAPHERERRSEGDNVALRIGRKPDSTIINFKPIKPVVLSHS